MYIRVPGEGCWVILTSHLQGERETQAESQDPWHTMQHRQETLITEGGGRGWTRSGAQAVRDSGFQFAMKFFKNQTCHVIQKEQGPLSWHHTERLESKPPASIVQVRKLSPRQVLRSFSLPSFPSSLALDVTSGALAAIVIHETAQNRCHQAQAL